jgi:hypothetical protein
MKTLKRKHSFKEGDKVLLRTVRTMNLIWGAGKYNVVRVELGKSFRYAVQHKKFKGSYLFINQKETIKRAKLVS